MRKLYLVDEDKYSGKIVIECETFEEEIDIYIPTRTQLEANLYLGRSIPVQKETKTFYKVTGYYHYEDENRTKLYSKTFDNKNDANEYFKELVEYMK